MDEQGGASIEKNERTLLTDAEPQTEDFVETNRYKNETTSTRDSDDKSSDIINKSEIPDKNEVPEIFTNDSGTSDDKNTTYSFITDVEHQLTEEASRYENAHGTTSMIDDDNDESLEVSECKEGIEVVTDGGELTEPPTASDSIVQPRNTKLINRSENETTQNTTNSTDEKHPDATDKPDSSEEYLSQKRNIIALYATMLCFIQSSFISGLIEAKVIILFLGPPYVFVIVVILGTFTSKRESNKLNIDEGLLNTKTTMVTKITKQSIAKCVLDETITRIEEILKRIKKQQPCTLKELEFRNSELKMKQLNEFLKETLVCEISKLSIGFTEHVTDLIPSYCRIASRYKTSKLSLIYDDLKKEDIEALLNNLDENDKYTELDISYNSNIEPAGYENVGKIVQKHEIRTLRLADCDISDEDLEYLFNGMGNAKLEVLDISCTDNLTAKGFAHIGKQVSRNGITRLKLSNTQLNVETLTAFYNEVAGLIEDSEGQQVLVEEIDVSYNSTMESKAYKVLGSMVKLFGVKKLSLAGCGISKEHLKNLKENMNTEKNKLYTKMKSLNVRDNKGIGEGGIVELAKIVKVCRLEVLNISKCRLSANELYDFIKALENAKLNCLYLGEKRQFDKNYISQVCNLLPRIEEMLRLEGMVRENLQSMLQEKLNELEGSKLKIKLDNNMTFRRLRSQIEDDAVSLVSLLQILHNQKAIPHVL